MLEGACYDFLSEHEDDIIDGLVSRKQHLDVEDYLCSTVTKACPSAYWAGQEVGREDDSIEEECKPR